MNQKKAKMLRRRAENVMCEFVKKRILPEDLTENEECGTIILSLPGRIHMRKRSSVVNAIATRRWFYRLLKHHPHTTYNQIIKDVYGEAPTN